MLSKEQFHEKINNGFRFLDGATGSNLQKVGMPRGCCTEEWILANPEALVSLQRAYAQAGSQILMAPTFQAQPIALERVCLECGLSIPEDISLLSFKLLKSLASAFCLLQSRFRATGHSVCPRSEAWCTFRDGVA